MKKQYIFLACILAAGLLFSGCKKKEDSVPAAPAEATATPVPTVAEEKQEEEEDPGELVDMQASSEKEKNIIGKKTGTALKVELENQTDGEIAGIYVRAHDSEFDDDVWGEELIQGNFTLKNSEKAVYYYEKGSGDEDGLYDLRISYAEEGRSEFFFRMIPLETVGRLSFCVDDEEDTVIPYARYFTSGNNSREVSTLEEVKRRLGYYGDDEEETQEEEEPDETDAEPTPTEPPQEEAEPTQEPDNPYEQDPSGDAAAEARNYIGMSLDDLIAALGEPSGNDYQEEENGYAGYHYYDNFTVSTLVDENGNEVVSNVW